MNHLARNLSLLPEETARRIKGATLPVELSVAPAKSGAPVPRLGDTPLHSAYHPEREGERFGADVAPGSTAVVFGFGFGYHLETLARRDDVDLTVIEPDDGLLKAALTERDLTDILPRIRIVTPEAFAAEAEGRSYAAAVWLDHPPTAARRPQRRTPLYEPFAARRFAAGFRPKVMVVGPIYGGTVPTAASTARAFTRLGCDVRFVDHTERQTEYFGVDRAIKDAVNARTVKNSYLEYLGQRLAATVLDYAPDLIVALAQAPIPETALRQLRQYGAPLLFWFVENHRTIGYWPQLAPLYDYFFCLQKGELLDRLADAGAPYAGWLPQAADDEVCVPQTLSDADRRTYGAPVSFFGAGYPNRRRFFAEMLDLPGLALFGSEWDLSSPLGQLVKNGNRRMAPEEYVKIFAASAINLNLHSSLTATGIDPMADFVNPRTFEIPAAGGFELVDMRDDLGAMFDIGRELAVFTDIDDLREKIAHYLAHPEQRAAIAAAGRERVVFEHTVVHRAAKMLLVVAERDGDRMIENRRRRAGINDVDRLIAETTDPALKAFLTPMAGSGKLSLSKAMERIAEGDGPLTRPEQVFVMMNEMLS